MIAKLFMKGKICDMTYDMYWLSSYFQHNTS